MKKLDIMRNRDQAIASENALKVEEKKIDVEEIRVEGPTVQEAIQEIKIIEKKEEEEEIVIPKKKDKKRSKWNK